MEPAEDQVVVGVGGETTVVTQTSEGDGAVTNLRIDEQGFLAIECQVTDHLPVIYSPPDPSEAFFRPRQYPFV